MNIKKIFVVVVMGRRNKELQQRFRKFRSKSVGYEEEVLIVSSSCYLGSSLFMVLVRFCSLCRIFVQYDEKGLYKYHFRPSL